MLNKFPFALTDMIKILFIGDGFFAFLTFFCSGLTLLLMLFILCSWYCHLTIHTLDGLGGTVFLMPIKLLASNLLATVLALLEIVELLLMLFGIIDIVGTIALSASFDVTTTIA